MPSVAKQAIPPVLRTRIGEQFCRENQGGVLMLEHCSECNAVQYPPRERCRTCLADSLVCRETNNTGAVLSVTQLHHSQGEFFQKKISDRPWPVASILLAHQCLMVHLASATFSGDVVAGSELKVFTAKDTSGRPVLISVSPDADISGIDQRNAISKDLGLT